MEGLKAATLNLHGRKDRWLERRQLIVAEIIDLQPDIIGLQEVYRPIGQARWLKNQVNSRISGRTEGIYRLFQRRRRQLIGGYFEGIAVLCKLPVISSDSLDLGSSGCLALRVNVELPTRETLDFVTLQLDKDAARVETRLEQVLKLQGWLYGRNLTLAQVIAGDFRTTPMGLAIDQMKQNYRSLFEEFRGHELIATYPTALGEGREELSHCFDYIFASASIGEVIKANLFCHRPASVDPVLYPSSHVGLLAEISVD